MVRCEICSRNYPKNQINEHIQIELQDPRYIEIRNEVMEKGKTTTMPSGSVIAKHLQQLKRKRPDIFNPADEEEQIMTTQKRQAPAPPPPSGMSSLIPPPPPPKPTGKQ
jgi:splicing factor 3A subunit 1